MFQVEFQKNILPLPGSSSYYNLRYKCTVSTPPQLGMEFHLTIPSKGLRAERLFVSGKIEHLIWEEKNLTYICLVEPRTLSAHDTDADIKEMHTYYQDMGWELRGPFERGIEIAFEALLRG